MKKILYRTYILLTINILCLMLMGIGFTNDIITVVILAFVFNFIGVVWFCTFIQELFEIDKTFHRYWDLLEEDKTLPKLSYREFYNIAMTIGYGSLEEKDIFLNAMLYQIKNKYKPLKPNLEISKITAEKIDTSLLSVKSQNQLF